MKIKFKKDHTQDGMRYTNGQMTDMDDAKAQTLIDDGVAESADGPSGGAGQTGAMRTGAHDHSADQGRQQPGQSQPAGTGTQQNPNAPKR